MHCKLMFEHRSITYSHSLFGRYQNSLLRADSARCDSTMSARKTCAYARRTRRAAIAPHLSSTALITLYIFWLKVFRKLWQNLLSVVRLGTSCPLVPLRLPAFPYSLGAACRTVLISNQSSSDIRGVLGSCTCVRLRNHFVQWWAFEGIRLSSGNARVSGASTSLAQTAVLPCSKYS